MDIRRTVVERITIRGDMNESDGAFAYCASNDYHITRSGAEPAGAGRVNPRRFLIVAERVTVAEEALPAAG